MAIAYHWKHGWIPLDHGAALSKAKGNHEAASRMLEDAHGPGVGIKSRRDVAKAVHDLPNVPESHRREAKHEVTMAAVEHNATDLLPRSMRGLANTVASAQERHRRLESTVTARVAVRQGIYRGQKGHIIVGKDSRGRKVSVFVPGDRAAADRVAGNIRAGREPFAAA